MLYGYRHLGKSSIDRIRHFLTFARGIMKSGDR